MSEDTKLDEFVDAEREDTTGSATDTDILDQEKFGPFTLSTPGEWGAKRLGDIKKLITRGKQPTYDDGGIPVINQECIYWDGWHFENLRYLDEDVGRDWKNKYFPQRGDVILNSTGQGTLGRAQVYPDNQRRAIDSHVTLLRTEDELNPYFHRYFLESHLGQALLYSMCVNGSTGQIELSKTRLDLQPVPLPPLPEQRKIASVLHTVDRAIKKTNEINERVASLKTGLIEQLTTRGIEHNEFKHMDVSPGYLDIEVPSSWKKVSYEDVSTNITYGFTSPMPEAESGPWMITAKDINDGRIDYSEARKTTEEAFSETLTSKSRPEPGTVLITKDGTLGNVAVVDKEGICINQSVASINPIKEKIHPEFLALALKSPIAKKQIKAYNPQTTIGHIKISELAKWELALPPIKEQEEIISIAETIRARESASKEYKQRLQRLKRGLMQDLLSGKVRTINTNIEVPDKIARHG